VLDQQGNPPLEALTKPETRSQEVFLCREKQSTARQSTAVGRNEEIQTFLNILAMRNTSTKDLHEPSPEPTL
jgi:hypothetical protein